MSYFILKWVHVVASTVLLGTGAGIAFFFWRANRTRDIAIIAAVAREVVLADTVFTAVAVIVQPVTGMLMMLKAGYPMGLPWIKWAFLLYIAVGCCWLPVVWLQLQMRNLAVEALRTRSSLPPAYFKYFRWWLVLGWPAFLGVLVIFWLMIAKPAV